MKHKILRKAMISAEKGKFCGEKEILQKRGNSAEKGKFCQISQNRRKIRSLHITKQANTADALLQYM